MIAEKDAVAVVVVAGTRSTTAILMRGGALHGRITGEWAKRLATRTNAEGRGGSNSR